MTKYIVIISLFLGSVLNCGKNKDIKAAVAILKEVQSFRESTASSLDKATSAKEVTDVMTDYTTKSKEYLNKTQAALSKFTAELPPAVGEAKSKADAAGLKVTQSLVQTGLKFKSDKDFMTAMKALGLDAIIP